jgi:uncharacterized membrane protein YfcA
MSSSIFTVCRRRRWICALIHCFASFLSFSHLDAFIIGAVVVPALSVLTNMNHYQALGTSLCAMVLPAMAGTATHYTRGNVAMAVAPYLAGGAFAGAYGGGKFAQTIDERRLQYGFSGLMVVLGVRALMK